MNVLDLQCFVKAVEAGIVLIILFINDCIQAIDGQKLLFTDDFKIYTESQYDSRLSQLAKKFANIVE